MRGLLFFDLENHQVVVKGFLDWSVFWFSIVLLSLVLFPGLILLKIGILFVYILFIDYRYLSDKSDFAFIADYAAHLWASNNDMVENSNSV